MREVRFQEPVNPAVPKTPAAAGRRKKPGRPAPEPPADERKTRRPQPKAADIEIDARWSSEDAWELELLIAAAIVAGGYQKDIGAWVKVERVPAAVAKNRTGWKYSIMVGRHDDKPMAVSSIRGMVTRGRNRLIQIIEERGADDADAVSRRIHPEAARFLTPQRPPG